MTNHAKQVLEMLSLADLPLQKKTMFCKIKIANHTLGTVLKTFMELGFIIRTGKLGFYEITERGQYALEWMRRRNEG